MLMLNTPQNKEHMNHINTDDFYYSWRGQEQKKLLDAQASLLKPIDTRGSGHERALLLIHGFASSPAVFRIMLPALTGYDAYVCPTLPGHGANLDVFTQ